MEDNAIGNQPQLFKELPKEQRKALQKEYNQTAEAKKANKTFTIIAIIFAVVVITCAVIGLLTDNDGFFGTFPVFIICIWPAIISQQKFEKWLAAEKNIVMAFPKKAKK